MELAGVGEGASAGRGRGRCREEEGLVWEKGLVLVQGGGGASWCGRRG